MHQEKASWFIFVNPSARMHSEGYSSSSVCVCVCVCVCVSVCPFSLFCLLALFGVKREVDYQWL